MGLRKNSHFYPIKYWLTGVYITKAAYLLRGGDGGGSRSSSSSSSSSVPNNLLIYSGIEMMGLNRHVEREKFKEFLNCQQLFAGKYRKILANMKTKFCYFSLHKLSSFV
jgi:hypothetical protein